MKNYVYSFLSRLALPGLMLLIMTAGTLSADTFNISVDFGGGFTGTGSFNTDMICNLCVASAGTLTDFTFTVGDDTFDQAAAVRGFLTYIRSRNMLANEAFGSDDARTSLYSTPARLERRGSPSRTPTTRLHQ
jgi:hypothetical protein